MIGRIICLKEVPGTVSSANKALESFKRFGIDGELFYGCRPTVADKIAYDRFIGYYLPGPKLYRIKLSKGGVRGCFMSHFLLWEECSKGNEDYLILEHDSVLVDDPKGLEFRDVLHLDPWRFEEMPEIVPGIYPHIQGCKGDNIMRGAYAYIIKPHAAKALVKSTFKYGMTAADMHISDRCGVYLEEVHPRKAIVTSNKSLTSDRNFRL